MSYEPTKWNTGDKITADKLNKLEAGVAGTLPVFMVNIDPETEEYVGDSALLDGTGLFVCGVGDPEGNEIKTRTDGPSAAEVVTFRNALFIDDIPDGPFLVVYQTEFSGTKSYRLEGSEAVSLETFTAVDPDTKVANYTCLAETVRCMTIGEDVVFLPAGTQVVRGTKEEQQESQ